ncbi:MAG: tryptophan transporter [Clostridiales bacterium]|uniref:tryptophan transporter n=1 Tax=Clostridium sp. N3C TaxID=1776758 RepID=UPI00092E16EB|nr:tryptophan transporter [Clostridium sp. N3C]NLZ49177.1 tryptophan transporter [Clostridiales bacterium]SCN25128.1 putative tryptophan transport protein [Clostridium sp. N3C]
MNTKKLTLASILLAIGLVLHYAIPGTLGAMKPDAMLAMIFIAIFICDDYKSTLAISVVAGIITALTTSFPGGQIPNIIDKLVTCQVVFLLVKATNKLNHQVKMIIISIIGTLVSGSVFLYSAMLIVGLPAGSSFTALFIFTVLPATLVNTVLALIVYNILFTSNKRISYIIKK